MKKTLSYSFRILITAFFVWLALRSVTFEDYRDENGQWKHGFLSLFKNLDQKTYVLYALFLFLPYFSLSLRWWLILRTQSIFIPFSRAFALTYAGIFFNNFLPTSVGGEVVKAILVMQGTDKKITAATTVLVDRLLGIVMLILFTAITISFCLAQVELHRAALIVFILFFGMLFFYFLYFNKAVRRLRWFQAVKRRLPLQETLQNIDGVFHSFRNQKKVVVLCLFISLVSQVASIATVWGCAQALHMPQVRFYHLLVFSPLVWIFTTVLPSMGGWGVGENAYAFLLAPVRVDTTDAIALSILFRITQVLVSLPGIVFFTFSIRRSKKGHHPLVGSN